MVDNITQSSSVKVVYCATSVVISTLTRSRAASPSLYDCHCHQCLIVFMKILAAFVIILSIPASLSPSFYCFHENSRSNHNNLCTWQERWPSCKGFDNCLPRHFLLLRYRSSSEAREKSPSFLSLLSPDLVAALVEEEGGQLVALVVLLLQLLARQCHLATKMEDLVDKAIEGKMKLHLKNLKVELLCRLQPLCDLFQITLFFSKWKSAPNFTNLKGDWQNWKPGQDWLCCPPPREGCCAQSLPDWLLSIGW